MSTADSGPQSYQTVSVTVALCVVTELTATNAPSPASLTYTIFSLQPTVLDVSSPGFNQVPACGYYLFNTFTWTIPINAPITKSSSNDYQVIVNSANTSQAGPYDVTLSVSALHAATMTTFTKAVSFTVTVVDPCLNTAWAPLSIANASIAAGQAYTWTYSLPAHSAGTTVSDQAICGTPTHTVFKIVNNAQQSQTMVTHTALAGISHKLVADNLDESHVAVQALRLVIDLGNPNYPKKQVDFTLTVTGASCDCTLLSWV